MSKHIDDLDADPILIPHKGRLQWLFPSGRLVADIRGGDGPDDEKKFTQEDMDRVVEDRLKRERAKTPEPPADYDDLKAAKVELDRLKAATLTAEEATAKRIADLETAVQKSNADIAAANEKTAAANLRSAIVAAAATHKAIDPDQVADLMLVRNAVTKGDDGQATDAVGDVKKFIDTNPHFVGAQKLEKDPALGQRNADVTPSVASGREMFENRRGGGTRTASTTTNP